MYGQQNIKKDVPFNGQNVQYAVETELFYITWVHVLTVGSLPQ
jgi:hypothetical protein